MSKTRKIVRDARNGQIVKSIEAVRRPDTTVTETVKIPTRKPKGK